MCQRLVSEVVAVEILAAIPVDEDGFLRRECPSCERQFKWFHGQTDGRPDDFIEPDVYFCPYCGEPAGHGSWWTPAQLEYQRNVAIGPMLEEAYGEIKRTLGNVRSSFIKVDVKTPSLPEPPMPLIEPNDMVMVAPPCHPFEPLKVLEDWSEPLTCLMCGDRFAV